MNEQQSVAQRVDALMPPHDKEHTFLWSSESPTRYWNESSVRSTITALVIENDKLHAALAISNKKVQSPEWLVGLPEGTTHISKIDPVTLKGGTQEATFYAFKYRSGELVCYSTDSDNEYACWKSVERKFKEPPEIFQIAENSAIAAAGAGDAEAMAAKFHETYEQMAPSFGYETRAETKVFDADSPNGRLRTDLAEETRMHDAMRKQANDSAALATNAVPVAWQSIKTAPKNRTVLAGYLNQLGNWRTVRACFYPENTLPMHEDYGDGENGSGYASAGWYEETVTHEVVMPLECDPTHWMPLPPAPCAAPQPDSVGDTQAVDRRAIYDLACHGSAYVDEEDFQSASQAFEGIKKIVLTAPQPATVAAGEPGNWNGAEPVRKRIAELKALAADAVPVAWQYSKIEKRIQEMMVQIGFPDSHSIATAFKQFANELHAEYATPQPATVADCEADHQGYVEVFYELSALMGIAAQPLSPSEVWLNQMLPSLKLKFSQPALTAQAEPSITLIGVAVVATVLEQLDGNEARIRWQFNPVPDGEELLWDHGALARHTDAGAKP